MYLENVKFENLSEKAKKQAKETFVRDYKVGYYTLMDDVILVRMHGDDKPQNAEYRYGMRLRGFLLCCIPKEGFLRSEIKNRGKYYGILVYNRGLTPEEMKDFELDDLN